MKIKFMLERDEEGYPPFDSELLWARQVGGGVYEIDSIPMFAKLVSWGDKVTVDPASDDRYLVNFSPNAVQKSLTDADGKFSLRYPRDRAFAIFAVAERSVGTNTEKFCWLVNAPTGVESAQILLSNHNLVTLDPDNYFKIKPK
jgi:hypothetical protein